MILIKRGKKQEEKEDAEIANGLKKRAETCNYTQFGKKKKKNCEL